MDKVYLAELDRFGYTLRAVGRTEKEARDAVMRKYTEVFIRENGTDPARTTAYEYGGRTYTAVAKDELNVHEMTFGEAEWA